MVDIGYKPLPLPPTANPNSFYRMIGDTGYQDWLDSGAIRPRENTKQQYNKAYFSKGAPLDRYARGGDVYVESNSPKIKQMPNKFFGVDKLTNKDPYTIWRGAGDTAEMLYKNIPTTALRRGVGAIGSFVNKMALPLIVGETVYNAGEDQRARNAYKQWQVDRANIPKNTELRNLPVYEY